MGCCWLPEAWLQVEAGMSNLQRVAKRTRQPAVRVVVSTLARPKSAILATVPVWSSSTLLGLQSNQTTPRLCR